MCVKQEIRFRTKTILCLHRRWDEDGEKLIEIFPKINKVIT